MLLGPEHPGSPWGEWDGEMSHVPGLRASILPLSRPGAERGLCPADCCPTAPCPPPWGAEVPGVLHLQGAGGTWVLLGVTQQAARGGTTGAGQGFWCPTRVGG